MRERGNYGTARLGADFSGGGRSSIGTWIVGGLLVGGAVLWAKHQSSQIEKLYAAASLPHQSFVSSVAETARERIQGIRHRLGTRSRSSTVQASAEVERQPLNSSLALKEL